MSQDIDTTVITDAAPPVEPAAVAPEPSRADALAALQQANDALTTRIDELLDAQSDRETLSQRLATAEAESHTLRTRYRDVALAHALDEAAAAVGISPQAAAMFRSRFTCTIDDAGAVAVTPDPADVLAGELQTNPLLRHSVNRNEADFRAAAVTTGATPLADVDPVELITALDRSPTRKAHFITRHGPQAFLDLAAAARQNGYRI